MKQLDELKTWYGSLQQREQQVLAAGAVVVLAMLVYAAILHPYFASKKRLADDIQSRQTELAVMQPMVAQLQALRGQQPSSIPANQSLLAVVSRSAGDAGFAAAVKQAQTNSDGSVHLQLQGVAFDNLVRWIGNLHRQYGISVRDMTAQRGTGAGVVDTSLTFATGT